MIAAVAVLALSFTSCKKDRTCTCITTGTSSGVSYTSNSTTTIYEAKTKEARSMCLGSQETTVTTAGGSTTTDTGDKTTCELK